MSERALMGAGLIALLLMMLAGCAGPQVSVTVPEGPGEKRIALTASSFDFEPSEIVAGTGDRLLLAVENTAGMEHNLTVVDPEGKTLISRGLPAGETVELELHLAHPGDYPFYCDKPLHPTMGMKGTIRVR